MEKENVKILTKKGSKLYYHKSGKSHLSCIYCTPKHLTNNENNKETHFAYEDGDSDYGHMDTTHLDIGDFFSKPDGSIDYLIGDRSVRK